MWYKNFANQLIDTYKENSYKINSINIFDVQNGSSPDLLKTFKSIVQKDDTVLTDLTSIIDWMSDARFFEKIDLKFKTLKSQFATNKLHFKFIQQIGDKTAMATIYKNEDETFLQQNSKIILEISVDEEKKLTLETKSLAFVQFTLVNNYLPAFLATVIENMLNANSHK